MLEILVDARYVPLETEAWKSFEFFGVQATPKYLQLYNHPAPSCYDPDDATKWPTLHKTLHVVCAEQPNGDAKRGRKDILEFIVPVASEFMRHMSAIERHGGVVLCKRFYRAEKTYINYDACPAHMGAFKVPTNHYYFRGVLHVQ